jgi:hypothetical protein
MIKAGAGGKLAVIGKRMAMLEVGPSPGKIPVMVPKKHPIKPNIKFSGLNACHIPKIKSDISIPCL